MGLGVAWSGSSVHTSAAMRGLHRGCEFGCVLRSLGANHATFPVTRSSITAGSRCERRRWVVS